MANKQNSGMDFYAVDTGGKDVAAMSKAEVEALLTDENLIASTGKLTTGAYDSYQEFRAQVNTDVTDQISGSTGVFGRVRTYGNTWGGRWDWISLSDDEMAVQTPEPTPTAPVQTETEPPKPDTEKDYGEWMDNGEAVTYYLHENALVQTSSTGDKIFRPDRNTKWGTFDNDSQYWLVDGLTGDSFYIDGGADIDLSGYSEVSLSLATESGGAEIEMYIGDTLAAVFETNTASSAWNSFSNVTSIITGNDEIAPVRFVIKKAAGKVHISKLIFK